MESVIVEVPQPTKENFHLPNEPGLLFQYLDGLIGSYGCSSSQVSIDDFSDVSSSFPSSATMPVDDQPMNFPGCDDHFQEPLNFQGSSTLEDQLMADEVEDVSYWLVNESSLLLNPHGVEDKGGSLHKSPVSSEALKNTMWNQTSMFVSTNQDMEEVDKNVSIFHLLKAYGEAIEIDCLELAEEISRKLQDKSCPIGSPLQRLAYYLFQALDRQVDILMEEAGINCEAAFKPFYQIFPYSRFAHFCANSVILAAMPNEAKVLHIVDFDLGNGVQWPPVLEALARQGKKSVTLTAIKWAAEDFSTQQKFEVTKLKLLDYARVLGLQMEVEENEIDALMSKIRKETRGESEWLAFNCMVGLPHMGKGRSISNVINFLKMAKDSIRGSNRGTITFGDGIGWGRGMTGRSGYGHIFEGLLAQFQAILESMDCDLLQHLREARVAMEYLFLKPYFASLVDVQMWEDISKESRALCEVGLEAWKMQKENLIEAKELVMDGAGSYLVSIEGAMENQMVLGYKGTPLVKVSSWR